MFNDTLKPHFLLHSTMRASTFLFLSSHLLLCDALYAPLREYAGQTFFSGWTFPGYYDNTTSGSVIFVDHVTAIEDNLVYINDAGNAILRVDNSTDITVTGTDRNSVKLISQDLYPLGSLIIIDIIHMPYGCSVWPAFWTLGGTDSEWPMYGEIDIIEGVNLDTSNQMAIHHSDPSCVQSANPGQSGETLSSDCSNGAGSVGCRVAETKSNSFGESFAQNGGGAFALQFDVSGAYIWFWPIYPRPSPPPHRRHTWIPPIGEHHQHHFRLVDADLEKLFKPQKLILDITLCGNWAGSSSIFNTQCSGSCIQDYVLGPGSPKYDNAWFEISYLRTYTAIAGNATSSGSGAAQTATGTTAHVATGGAAASTTSSTSSAGRSYTAISWTSAGCLLLGLVSLRL
ncbi:glycoside hydrolase family 16 protein [Armillaria novae-zelandiae]|uniref:Glycoside hydrolase family 16 protein n=1 Tax=Armillaria novae-zelandiae TaxID=153914 RepID=A0AA39PW41_9AGAR|nr:glycoside hydrolase family 16 protein [Armillaria novae-zelandiae]